MTIAVLGWGSLIPCPGDLLVRGNWHRDGPVLNIEFSRKSADGRLTLVIDAERGSPVTTQYIESASPDLRAAILNLRRREGTTERNIGVCSRNELETRSENHPDVLPIIAEWLNNTDFHAVIWTDLIGDFAPGQNREQFLSTAFEYLSGLTGVCQANARDYINRAPKETQTALRRFLTSKGWL
jgi:hypothetical protein